MNSSSTNRRPQSGRPRPPVSNRQEWIPRTSSRPSPSSVPQLVSEIQDKLSRGAVECMICCDVVRRSSAVWSCPACFSIFHLHCIRKWARSPTSAADPSSADWRCPGCQSPHSIPAADISYLCFCGRRPDPPNDLYLTPHSCGEPCGKPLDREGEGPLRCNHVCVLQCHPGPCPPCKAFGPCELCCCGRTEVVRRCSERRFPLSCGQVCDRLRECGRHYCEQPCHAGPCELCREVITVGCFCGKKTEPVVCGRLFTCDLRCEKRLLCGNHDCGENCHSGDCGECELLPWKIKTCYCGKKSVVSERKSCLDPIPTCSEVCGKALICGNHFCEMRCHEGNCHACSVLVEQRCRCGASRQTVECYRLFDERFSFVCEKTCGRKKNCGRHRCSERCCPSSKSGGEQFSGGDWDPHFCAVPCGKRLQCGNHTCQLLCHSGYCPPCLETIFTDLSCACGKTSIPPPIPCGTAMPPCPHPCSVAQPCGHPASHSCHLGDCPPCTIPVVKECIGGHVMLRNIPCGSKDIRCNQFCGKTRQCGIHACARTCHPLPCDSSPESESAGKISCGQGCGAPRRDCKHTCVAPCHPSSACPDQRCEFATTISCSCGRITATVPCGAGASSSSFSNDNTLFEASIIQKLPVPLQPIDGNGKKVSIGQRKLVCNSECDKAARKRQLADAFDVAQPSIESLHLGESSEVLSDLMRREAKWVLAVEDRFKFMVLGKSKPGSGNNIKAHVFCHMIKEKRDAVRFIAERWKLSVQAAGWEPKRFVVVHVTPKSKPPARIISAKPGVPVIASHSHPPAYDPLIDMDPRFVVAMLDLPRDADISTLVLRFGGECELVWLNDKNALSVFGDPVRAATALRRLDHGSSYQGAVAVVPQSVCGGVSAAGAAATGGSSSWGQSNAWKMAVAPAADSWGSGADLAMPVWKRSEGISSIPPTVNRWNMLDFDDAIMAKSETESQVLEGGSTVESLVEKEEIVDVGFGHEVDNWEEACE